MKYCLIWDVYDQQSIDQTFKNYKRTLCTQSKVQIDFIGHAIFVSVSTHVRMYVFACTNRITLEVAFIHIKSMCGFVIYYLLQTLIFATLFDH